MEQTGGTIGLPRLRTCILLILGFFAVTLATFGSSLGNKFVTWDDMSLIVENANVQHLNAKTLKAVFTSYDPELYIPLTFVSYQIDYVIGRLDSFIYHLHNLVLHTLSALLVTWLLALLLGNGYLAIFLGLLFALHPLNVESVVWASARKDVLSTFFVLGSVLSWLHWTENRRLGLYALSLLLFLFALLSKVAVLMLPVVLLLLDVLQRRRVNVRALTEKIPFFVLSVLFGVIALFGKTENLVTSTLSQKILLAGKSAMFYLPKLVAPDALSPIYPFNGVISLFSAGFLLPMVAVIALLGLAVFLWNRMRAVSVAILFYFATLLPTFLNLTKGGNVYIASDRYAYIPMIGLLALAGAGLDRWLSGAGTVRSLKRRRAFAIGSAIAILLASGVASAKQAARWADSETLYRYVLAYYPEARAAHNNLGMELMETGRLEEAVSEFKAALALQSDPRMTVNLAAAYVRLGMLPEALETYGHAIRLDPELPDGYYGIGNIFEKQGKLSEAVVQYRRTLEVNPTYTNALNNLGGVSIRLREWDSAIAALERSIELKPDFAAAHYNLGVAYQQKGVRDQAELHYARALRISPDDPDALANLALLLYEEKRIDEAARLLKQAFLLQQDNPAALSLLLRMKKDGVVR
ncbi:MAG: tetratricopeptide repeat protein [Candidatus Peribacteraceae bacterium]